MKTPPRLWLGHCQRCFYSFQGAHSCGSHTAVEAQKWGDVGKVLGNNTSLWCWEAPARDRPSKTFPMKWGDFQKDQQKNILETQAGEQQEGTSPSPLRTIFPSSPSPFLLALLPFLLTCFPAGDTSAPLLSALGHARNPGNSPCTSLPPTHGRNAVL